MQQRHERRQRKALTHIGGEVTIHGEGEDADALAEALAVRSDEQETRAHVHGFHSYTARMHPLTARRLVERLSAPGAAVLDPFCGSGTVLVEARLLDRRAYGVDANPLAVELARLKTRSWPVRELDELVAKAAELAEAAEARRKAKAGATRRYGLDDRELFDAHVLLELDGLRAGIEGLARTAVRDALWLALSSILVKVSRQPGDTADGLPARRLAGGFAIRTFQRRVEELVRQLDAFARLAPDSATPAEVALGDARDLTDVPAGSIDLIVTSPPYPGVYDYFEHHAPRLRWLGFDAQHLAVNEIGSRRELTRLGPKAAERWCEDFGRVLRSMARVLAANGAAVLLIGDSAIGSEALFADELVERLAPTVGLRLATIASQERPHFHGPTQVAFRTRPRSEHAILLRKRR